MGLIRILWFDKYNLYTTRHFFYPGKSMPKTVNMRDWGLHTWELCELKTSTLKQWFLMCDPSRFAFWNDETYCILDGLDLFIINVHFRVIHLTYITFILEYGTWTDWNKLWMSSWCWRKIQPWFRISTIMILSWKLCNSLESNILLAHHYICLGLMWSKHYLCLNI